MFNLEKDFAEIDKIDDIEELNALYTALKESSIMKIYWQQRLIALTGETDVERKRAAIKCRLIQRKWGAYVPINKSVKRFSTPHGLSGIHISSGAKIGTGCTIYQHVVIGSNTFLDSKNHGFPVIGNNVFIGAGATIIGNVKIGDNVRIGANCIVTKDVPENSVCVLSGSKTIIKDTPLDNKFIPADKYRHIIREMNET